MKFNLRRYTAVDFETKAGHTALGVAATAGAHATCARLVDIGAFVDRASAKVGPCRLTLSNPP